MKAWCRILNWMQKHSEEGIIVTATGRNSFDFTVGFLGPMWEFQKILFTQAFAHCALMDIESAFLEKNAMRAYQASKRGGSSNLESR